MILIKFYECSYWLLLAQPLEKHLRTVEGLDVMKSVASEGYGSVALEFAAGEDIDLVLADVRQAVDAVHVVRAFVGDESR